MTLTDFRKGYIEAQISRRTGVAGPGGLDTHEYPHCAAGGSFSTDRTIAEYTAISASQVVQANAFRQIQCSDSPAKFEARAVRLKAEQHTLM